MNKHDITSALNKAKEVLDTAYYGLKLIRSGRTSDYSPGVRNVLVFSRSTTFVIQNLRSIVGSNEFDEWYEPHRDRMKSDKVLKYFVEARNNLEKQGRLNVAVHSHLHFELSDLSKLDPPPRGARRFFIGDKYGGSGWDV